MNQRWMRSLFIYVLILVAVVAIFWLVFGGGFSTSPKEDLSTVIQLAKAGSIRQIEVDGDKLKVTRTNGDTFASRKESGSSIYEILQANGVPTTGEGAVHIKVKDGGGMGSFLGILFSFLPFIFLIAIIFFMMRQAQGTNSQAMNFGRSRARMFVGNRPTVTFGDVAGVDEAKQELQEVVEFLKYPEKFAALGARIPKGVLLVGPPGTGKTLLAKAVAGEAGVPFFSISGSEFVEMFVGVGASRVRDLFDQAKRNSPCIVFIDEIDAVGRHRGAGMGGGHDEREQTLNQILVEMDGFDTGTNIIVVAATNRPDILDPALLRPGRFDRRVVLDQPDINGRKAILQVHVKGKPMAPDVTLDKVARETPGFSGADLANLVNEAAILAARRNKKAVTMSEMEESIDRVIAGPERKSRLISQKEKEITAYHESGHALAARLVKGGDPVHKISIVARGMMGGYTRLLPAEDRYLYTKTQFQAMLAIALGGRAAELLIFKETTTGAGSDLENATRIARKMITEYGMSDLPDYEEMPLSRLVALALDKQVQSVEVYGHDLLVHSKDGKTYRSKKEEDFSLVQFLRDQKVDTGPDGVQVYVKRSGGVLALGPRTFGKKEELVFLGKEIAEQRDYGDKVAEAIDDEIKALIEQADLTARTILKENEAKLHQMAKYLIQKETVDGDEIDVLFTVPPEATIAEIEAKVKERAAKVAAQRPTPAPPAAGADEEKTSPSAKPAVQPA